MRISVVIPTYNYACFIREAVESVLNQTRQPHEVIVVDDGSTDDTAEVLKPYTDAGRIRYHRQDNAGLCAARNAGLSLATGDAFALLDSDDAWHPKKLEYQTAYLESHPECGLVGTACSSEEPVRWPEIGTAPAEALPLQVHPSHTRFAPSSAVFRRSSWEQVGGFDPATGGTSDRDYWIRCATLSSVVRLNAPLTFYRIHSGSMTATKVVAMVATELFVIEKAFRSIPALRSKTLLKRRAYAITHRDAAYTIWRDAGRPRLALRHLCRSLLLWPVLLDHPRYKFVRLRLGPRLLIAALRGRPRKPTL